LIGRIQAVEPSPGGQGNLLIESTGTTYYFRTEDGAYDGWGIEVAETEGKLDDEGILEFIKAVEKDRKVHNKKEGSTG